MSEELQQKSFSLQQNLNESDAEDFNITGVRIKSIKSNSDGGFPAGGNY